MCFKWSILAKLHPTNIHAERVSNYKKFSNELNFENIKSPVAIKDIPKFEKLNNISVNVFGYSEEEVYPLYITKSKYNIHVDLLYISNEKTNHYCLIKDFNKLMNGFTKHTNRKFFCS